MKHIRWRRTFEQHLKHLIDHFYVFLAAKGRCRDFVKLNSDLQEETIQQLKSLEGYYKKYKHWRND